MPRGEKEEVKINLLDEKKLVTIMKRFLGTKKSDPEVTKYFRVENGLHYMATSMGSAVWIHFENKFDGSFTVGNGKSFFRKPLPKDKFVDVVAIPEIITYKDGNKNIEQATGRTLDYPDIPKMFSEHQLENFEDIEIKTSDVDSFISVHEAMSKVSKIGGLYNTTFMDIKDNVIKISLHDSPLTLGWEYVIPNQNVHFEYYYDFDLMMNIFKSLKDMKVDKISMYVKDENHPIIFTGRTLEYNYKFAINRKLVR